MTARKSSTAVALPVNAQKRAVAERMIQVIARELSSGKQITGVERAFALQVAGELCNYFPGVRQGLTKWDARLGSVSGAGAVKTAPKTKTPARKPAASRKPATTRKPATARKPAASTKVTPATAGIPQTASA